MSLLSCPTSLFLLRTSHHSLPTSLFSLRTSLLSWQTSQFSRSTSPLSYRTSLLSWECNAFVALAHFVSSSATHIGASTRTRAPTSRTHRAPNSSLHPSPSPLTTWKPEWYVWRFRPFLPSPGEQNLLFVFTFNFLIVRVLYSSGEEVKEKNEKRRTRAYTRALAIRMWCTFECKMIVLPLYCSRRHLWRYIPQARYRNCRSKLYICRYNSNIQLVQRFSSFRRSSLQISDEANICHLSPHLTIARLTNKAVSKKSNLYSND